MVTATVGAFLPYSPSRVWQLVTAVEDYAWRSDLERTEVLEGGRFVEYAKGGYATAFTTTLLQPCRRWEFDLENSNLRGHWAGTFSARPGGTVLCFTETVSVKRPFLKPFVKTYLKRQQRRFLKDLRNALQDRPLR